jgi:hypothetical protein
MAEIYSKLPKNIPTFSIPRPYKIYTNWEFGFEIVPSGNPVLRYKVKLNNLYYVCNFECMFFETFHDKFGDPFNSPPILTTELNSHFLYFYKRHVNRRNFKIYYPDNYKQFIAVYVYAYIVILSCPVIVNVLKAD